MSSSARFLYPSEAATRLGVSPKALRLYEQRGLVAPLRTEAGWRVYGPEQMARAARIAALRALGLSLAQVARGLGGDARGLEPVLAAHLEMLDIRIRDLVGTVAKVRALRADLAPGKVPSAGESAVVQRPRPVVTVALDLPWPWGGERFELCDIRRLNYIVGPLGSGKTRLAKLLAETLPGAVFLGLHRLNHDGTARARLNADTRLRSRVDRTVAGLVAEGAAMSEALLALLVGLESEGPAMLVVDMVEQGLDQATQVALIAHLRRRPCTRPLFLMTRSSSILDLSAVGPDETIIFCPANHDPPTQVNPSAGAPGVEAVATCLASPGVRSRTDGVIAWRPPSADHPQS